MLELIGEKIGEVFNKFNGEAACFWSELLEPGLLIGV